MPRSKAVRDMDLIFKEYDGIISKNEAKAISLRRDVKDAKKTIIYSMLLFIQLTLLGNMIHIPVYLTAPIFTLWLFGECYTVWMKSAEVETDIKYLEAGLRLIRN